MSIFGMIMMLITMGWTALLFFIVTLTRDIVKFLQGPAVLTFIIGYVIILVVFVVAKRIVMAL